MNIADLEKAEDDVHSALRTETAEKYLRLGSHFGTKRLKNILPEAEAPAQKRVSFSVAKISVGFQLKKTHVRKHVYENTQTKTHKRTRMHAHAVRTTDPQSHSLLPTAGDLYASSTLGSKVNAPEGPRSHKK